MASTAAQDRFPPGQLVLPSLCLASFVSMVHLTAPARLFPAISRGLGGSVALLGQILAAMLILGAVLGLVIGPLADRSGVRRFIVIGLLATVLALANYGLAPVYWVLLFASIAGAIDEGTVPGLTMAVAGSHFHGPAARHALSLTASATTSARIVGIPVMAMIGEVIGWRAAFLAAAAVTAAVA